MKKILSVIMFVVIGFAMVQAGDLGYVNSVEKITGVDGNTYIKVGHSSNIINVIVKWGPQTTPSWYAPEFYIMLGQDENYNNMQYATMIKCLSNHSMTIDPTSVECNGGIVSGLYLYTVKNYKINNP